MTRKELMERLNQLTLKYNLTWEEVKADGNMAIFQINKLLGADYPKLTEKLHHEDSTYTYIDDEGEAIPIIKDEYFMSVIIPYIAMQVLARDEEFTTIYSKYQQEFEEGKYFMFASEFNDVPDKFRRERVGGVFFPAGNQGTEARRQYKKNRSIDQPRGSLYKPYGRK